MLQTRDGVAAFARSIHRIGVVLYARLLDVTADEDGEGGEAADDDCWGETKQISAVIYVDKIFGFGGVGILGQGRTNCAFDSSP